MGRAEECKIGRYPATQLISTAVRFYHLDGDLILFDERRGRLFALNSTAAFVWLRLSARCPPEEIAKQLSDEAGVSAERATEDVDLLVSRWKNEGLFASAEATVPSEHDLPPAEGESSPEAVTRDRRRPSFERVVRLMDGEIHVTGDADLAPIVDALFGHAVVAGTSTDPERVTLEVFKHDDAWVALFDGTVIGHCSERTEVASLIYGAFVMLIYQTSDCFAALHAAAVAKGSNCVVMPAASGSGKSTLTAALIANGYDYCTDDLALLTVDPIRLRPVPLQIGLKHGAWPVLASLWPELEALPSYRRVDGQLIKYLPAGRRSPERSLAITAMVFPAFAAGEQARLMPISRSEALIRMTAAGYDFSVTLDRDSVETLVGWFQDLRCYELRFGDLREAVKVFGNVLA